MDWILLAVASLHAVFSLCELFPWSFPLLFRILSEQHLQGQSWTIPQRKLIASIVQNAGIYNAILAGGFLWAAYVGDAARDAARVLLIGAIVAGIFGAVTLKSWPSAIQALFGIVALVLV